MGTVETVQGAVDTARLGVTLMHEHIFVLSPEILVNYPEVWGDDGTSAWRTRSSASTNSMTAACNRSSI